MEWYKLDKYPTAIKYSKILGMQLEFKQQLLIFGGYLSPPG
jgi:hypothetical protein